VKRKWIRREASLSKVLKDKAEDRNRRMQKLEDLQQQRVKQMEE
jgi:hypothetical protein